MLLARQAVIAGIGETEYSRDSGRSELQLAAEASLAAIRDAGLSPCDIDGLVTFTLDNNDELELQRCLGIPDVRWTGRTPFGGIGANTTVQLAAAALSAGYAEAVLIYRAANGRSGARYGTPEASQANGMGQRRGPDLHYTMAFNTGAKSYAMKAQDYLRRFGVTGEDLGRYVVSARAFAATNPRAMFHGQPLSLEAHQSSRWIVYPWLRRFDCCLETDGGAALVVTTRERARDLRQPLAPVLAAAQSRGLGGRIAYDVYRSPADAAAEVAAMCEDLRRQSGIRPRDADVAIFYDAFSPDVLMALEAHGFCGPGEAKAFIAAGETGAGGSKPVNPHGGLIGEAYIHGVNNIIEGVRQSRGQAANQIRGVECVLVSGGSALMLGKD